MYLSFLYYFFINDLHYYFLDDKIRRNPHRAISADMVDWDHHHTGGKSSPRNRSSTYQSYSYDDEENRNQQDDVENCCENVLVRDIESVDEDECAENHRNEVVESKNPEQDEYVYDYRNEGKDENQNRDNVVPHNSKSIFATNECEQSPRMYVNKKINEENLNFGLYSGQQSQYASLTQMRNQICLPLPLLPTLVNHSTQYDLEELSTSQSDHTDTGTHSTSHLQQQVPIPLPILNRSINGIKSLNQSPSRIQTVASTERQSNTSQRSPPERSVASSPLLSHLTHSPSRTLSNTYHGDSIEGSIISNISKYPDTPDGFRRKQIYENVLKYTEDPYLRENNTIENLGEFKHLEQLLSEAGDGSVEVQRLKTVMRTIMLRRKESLKLLQSSIASSE